MIQLWHRVTRQKVTLSFAQVNEIMFPPLSANKGTEGPLVIEAEIGGHTIHRMYVDGGSSMEVLYEHCFNRLRPEIKSQMVPATTSLTGVSGETIWPLGQLRLLVTIGDAEHFTKAWMNFMIVRSPSPYNDHSWRPWEQRIQKYIPQAHGMLKFPVDGGVPRTDTPRPDSRQKKRGQAPERAKAIQAEVQKLVKAGIMREVYYRDWLSNPIMIQMAEMDEEKMAFHTPHGVYCYTKMPFGLKNDGATYQRLVDKAFEKQVGQNLEVYIDDLVIKSHTEAELLRDIEETFRPEGIKPCPEKIEVVLQLPSPWTIKEVQSLNGKLAGLNRPKEELILYLSASQGAVGAVLMAERDSIQMTVYFVSRALQGPELNYTPMEKLVLALVFTAKRLRRYFQAHPIAGQILADFLVEKPEEASADMSEKEAPQELWTLFTDGSSCIDGSGAGLILTSPDGAEFTYALRFQFTASNNEAEYEALLAGLRIAAQTGVRNVRVSVDSKLVENQVLGTYIAKEENMIKYLEKVKSLVSGFASFLISQVPRSHNKKADALSKIASTSFAHLSKQVLVEVLQEKSIQEQEVAAVVEEEGPTWMTPITEYLKDGVLPDDKKEADKLSIKARKYELMEGILYRRSFLRSWLRSFSERTWEGQVLDSRHGLFTKWIEAKVVATISGGQRFASVKHPQSNGLVERANRSVGEGIKARLGEGNKKWIEEIPHVLWAHRTMIKSSNGDTPFSLTYGTEAVIPAKIGMPTYRTAVVDIVRNDDEIRLNLDLLEERRERAAIREAKAKSKMMRYYNARVRGVTFKPGDYVYRSNEASHAMDGGKLGPKWEGPYEVTEVLGGGAYKLRSMDGAVLPRTWNIANLKKCYL
ncbi:reverse transcriptase domain-containing protein [Tanacetum coccineum]